MTKYNKKPKEKQVFYVVLDGEGAWITETPSEHDTVIFQSEDLAACERELCRACE